MSCVIFGTAQVPPPVPSENWLYRRLREASERVAKWPKEKQDAIVYTLEYARQQDRENNT